MFDKAELERLHNAIVVLVHAVEKLAREQHRLVALLEPKYPATTAIDVSQAP